MRENVFLFSEISGEESAAARISAGAVVDGVASTSNALLAAQETRVKERAEEDADDAENRPFSLFCCGRESPPRLAAYSPLQCRPQLSAAE